MRHHGVGGGQVLAVRDQRALRVAGGAGCVDDKGGVLGLEVRN